MKFDFDHPRNLPPRLSSRPECPHVHPYHQSSNPVNPAVHVTVVIAGYSEGIEESITLIDEDLVTNTAPHRVEVDPVLPSELLYRWVLCEISGRFVLEVVIY